MILISSAELAFETLKSNWEIIKIKIVFIKNTLLNLILDICAGGNLYKSNHSFFSYFFRNF